MNKTIKVSCVLSLLLLVISCGKEDLDDLKAEAYFPVDVTANITSDDLAGRWNLVSMISDEAVDFNDEDSLENNDIMAETDCFDEMHYIFSTTGKVSTTQARLFFNSTGIVSCESKDYSASYSVTGDELTITFLFNGVETTETKIITLSEDKNTLFIALSRAEASGYINDDSNSSTSSVGEVEMIYKRQQ